jgi:hypothetical protein
VEGVFAISREVLLSNALPATPTMGSITFLEDNLKYVNYIFLFEFKYIFKVFTLIKKINKNFDIRINVTSNTGAGLKDAHVFLITAFIHDNLCPPPAKIIPTVKSYTFSNSDGLALFKDLKVNYILNESNLKNNIYGMIV